MEINNCIILALEFMLSKLMSVVPIIESHEFNKSIHCNIAWYEKFMETVLCVLTKSELCKCVKFNFYKIKNNCEVVSNRQYILRAEYTIDKCKKKVDIPLDLSWTKLTRNDAVSFVGINGYMVDQVNAYIVSYNTMNIEYFVN